ncbi:MAG: hypothetical protein ACKV2Q_00820 [Planctomycetaceae bacterium]
MKPRNCLNRLVGLPSAKPAPRSGRWAGIRLETLECRLNLAAVLVIETSDAYWLYDDVDALVAAAADGKVTDSARSDPGSEFSASELQVIDELVAELIATEGYSDSDILAVTYLEDTTSDELIAGGFFDDPLFEGEFTNDFDTPLDFASDLVTIEFAEGLNEAVTESVNEAVTIDDDLSQLAGAAGNDSILLVSAEVVPDDKSLLPVRSERLGERLGSGTSLGSVETTTERAVATRRLAVRGTANTQNEVATSSTGVPRVVSAASVAESGVATSLPIRFLAAVQPLANAVQFPLPFAKFATTSFVAVGIGTTFRSAPDVSRPTNSWTADDVTIPAANETDGLSYSQITALFGAGGLAVAHWWNNATVSEPVTPSDSATVKARHRSRREHRVKI